MDDSTVSVALAAKDSVEDAFVFISGAFRHPAGSYPKPLTESDDGPTLVWRHKDISFPSGQPPGREVWGNVFIDGSSTRHPIRELSRAAKNVVMVDDTGDSVAEFRAPVWAPYPQTAQSVEFGCWTWANVLASSSVSVFSDCSNVVNLACRPRGEQLSGKRAYSGAVLQIFAQGSKPAPCIKVAAHKDPDDPNNDAAERWRRIGKHHADAAAKHAVRIHPSCKDKLDAADKLVLHARQTIRLAANVLHLWPALDLMDVERIESPPVFQGGPCWPPLGILVRSVEMCRVSQRA